MELQIWDAADDRDRAAWIDLWEQWPSREIFAHPDYLRLYAGPHDRALCAAASAGDSYVLYPFLLRALADEPYCDASLRDCKDIVSPYGYGGPFAWGASWDSYANAIFWSEFDVWAAKSHIVSEVVRLSLVPGALMAYAGERHVISDNVVRTLLGGGPECRECPCTVPVSQECLWRDFEYKVRKNVAKARSNGVTVQVDDKGERLDEFLAIYQSTMSRRNAEQAYYFPRDFFERIHRSLNGQFAYFHALAGSSKVISTELVLISADRIYSFLGGTDESYFHLRPNDLLKFEIMKWAKQNGKKEFVLGGGYTPGDGIYRYKLSFAPEGRVPFSIGFRILDSGAYDLLIQSRRALAAAQGCDWEPKAKFFPAYRG